MYQKCLSSCNNSFKHSIATEKHIIWQSGGQYFYYEPNRAGQISSLCLMAHSAFGFCNNSFYLQPTPTWRASGITLRLVPTLRPVWHRCPCQEYETPANITLGVTGGHKPPYHNKVAIPIETGTRHYYKQVSDAMQRAPRGRIPAGFLHPHARADLGGFRKRGRSLYIMNSLNYKRYITTC